MRLEKKKLLFKFYLIRYIYFDFRQGEIDLHLQTDEVAIWE